MDISGRPTSDRLIGTSDADTIRGEAGNDYIVGGAGLDTLDGGSGNDVIFTGNDFIVVQGISGYGIPASTTFDDVVGGDGDDVILGRAQGDAGDGNDIIVGGSAFFFGGAGNDIFLGGSGNGGVGDDTYIISASGSYAPLFDPGANRFVIDGNFSGDVRLGFLSPGSILEFSNIPSLGSLADVEARATRGSFETRIMIDADTSIYLANDIFDSATRPLIQFNQTDVAGLIAGINSRVAQAQGGINNEANTFIGTPDGEAIATLGGNDVIRGNGGNDTINGGDGIDTAQYSGPRSQYSIQVNGGTTTIVDSDPTRDGTDSLSEVERLQFSDTVLAFDLDGNAGQAYRVYQAAFDRVPDRPGLSYWVDQMDDGMSFAQVALNFILSPEFRNTYGAIENMSNAQYIDIMYENVLGRDPDSSGFAYWMNELSNGYPRHAMLAAFADSTENKANVAAAIQNGILLDLGAFV